MKKIFLKTASAVFIGLLLSCVSTGKAVGSTSSLSDCAGTYKGTFPCASCEGINVTLKLNENGTFILHEEYMPDGDTFKIEGTFTLQKDKNRIVLVKKETSETVYEFEVFPDKLTFPAEKFEDKKMQEFYILKKI